MRRPLAVLLALWAVLAVACSPSTAAAPSPGLQVVTTTTLLGDLAQRIVGEQGSVEVLMAPGQDPHGFRASPQQVQAIRAADLVVANGLGLESSMADVLSVDGVNMLEVGPLLDPRTFDGEDAADPHVWLDPVRWSRAALAIGKAIETSGTTPPPEGWGARAQRVADEVEAVRGAVETALLDVPQRCRLLVTNHDAFGYFADRFGFEVIGTVLPGQSTDAEPSAKEFAALADLLRTTGVPAIFAESIQSTRLAEGLAEEVGTDVRVVTLLSDALGEGDDGSYAGMLVTNAERIAQGLAPC